MKLCWNDNIIFTYKYGSNFCAIIFEVFWELRVHKSLVSIGFLKPLLANEPTQENMRREEKDAFCSGQGFKACDIFFIEYIISTLLVHYSLKLTFGGKIDGFKIEISTFEDRN